MERDERHPYERDVTLAQEREEERSEGRREAEEETETRQEKARERAEETADEQDIDEGSTVRHEERSRPREPRQPPRRGTAPELPVRSPLSFPTVTGQNG